MWLGETVREPLCLKRPSERLRTRHGMVEASVSSRADTHLEATDELAAAAAVLAMEVDSDADEDLPQETTSRERGEDLGRPPAPQASTAGRENERNPPEQREAGTDKQKVVTHPLTLRHAPCEPSFRLLLAPTSCPDTQVEMAALLERAEFLFPEGHGRLRAAAKVGAPAPAYRRSSLSPPTSRKPHLPCCP